MSRKSERKRRMTKREINRSNPRQKDLDTARGISGRRRARRELSVRKARRGPAVETPACRGEGPKGGRSPRMACLPASPHTVDGIPGQDMTRGEGAESARVFGMWTDLEAILVGRFCPLRHTVLRKSLKRGSHKGDKSEDYCDYCDYCTLLGRFMRENLPIKSQSSQ